MLNSVNWQQKNMLKDVKNVFLHWLVYIFVDFNGILFLFWTFHMLKEAEVGSIIKQLDLFESGIRCLALHLQPVCAGQTINKTAGKRRFPDKHQNKIRTFFGSRGPVWFL